MVSNVYRNFSNPLSSSAHHMRSLSLSRLSLYHGLNSEISQLQLKCTSKGICDVSVEISLNENRMYLEYLEYVSVYNVYVPIRTMFASFIFDSIKDP